MTAYEKARTMHFYEIVYGQRPDERRVERLFASDDLDAIDKAYTRHPDAILYDVYRIGR